MPVKNGGHRTGSNRGELTLDSALALFEQQQPGSSASCDHGCRLRILRSHCQVWKPRYGVEDQTCGINKGAAGFGQMPFGE